jgi:MFS family permease
MSMQNQRNPSAKLPEDARGRIVSARWALAGLSLSMLMPSLDTSICNVALPSLSRAFGGTFQQTQWIILAYLLAITALIVGIGRLGDLIGRRRLLLTGVNLFLAASVLCGAAPSLGVLITARALQGLGAAIMLAMTTAQVGAAIPREQTGRAMGLLGTMSAVGTALGPSLGGALLAALGWRAIFFVNVPLGLLALFLLHRFLPAEQGSARDPRTGFDPWGTLLLAGTLTAYALAMTIGHGHLDRLGWFLLLATFLGGFLFVLVELKVASPLIRPDLFRNAELSAGLAQNALVATVMMSTLVVGPFFLSRGLGFREAAVGLVMSFGPLVSILSGVPAGRMVDRLGAPLTTLAALTEMTVGAVALAILPVRFGVAGYLAAIAILTPGYQLFQAANNTHIMMGVHEGQRGVISGLLSLSRNLGLITGASIMGAVFASSSGTSDLIRAHSGNVAAGMGTTFALAAALLVVAIILAYGSRFRSNRSASHEADPEVHSCTGQ